jgi:hypothetical protein
MFGTGPRHVALEKMAMSVFNLSYKCGTNVVDKRRALPGPTRTSLREKEKKASRTVSRIEISPGLVDEGTGDLHLESHVLCG